MLFWDKYLDEKYYTLAEKFSFAVAETNFLQFPQPFAIINENAREHEHKKVRGFSSNFVMTNILQFLTNITITK